MPGRILAALTALERGIAARNADATELKRTTANTAAISTVFTDAVKAEEAEQIDDAEVRTEALKTLHGLMTDEYVPHAILADIAKYIIESRLG
ncbi:hypothetical protein JZX87_23000 [Agrobacterium sp. Ap1]|uniref:hypothetical protein n=1 Tax=Agrobacterium sp. Ap1 TaxID=2815337 RepID=UPI001A8D02AE|nr:hypothetical protein [Agrobacterium sp. Ap1]MBO0144028.1 hypothetical protein [Agrobacterium sp. Ap1]